MNNWRPRNWEKIVTKDWTQNYDEAGRLCFEAGADAMLEALKSMGTQIGLPHTAEDRGRKGWLLLLIPN